MKGENSRFKIALGIAENLLGENKEKVAKLREQFSKIQQNASSFRKPPLGNLHHSHQNYMFTYILLAFKKHKNQ